MSETPNSPGKATRRATPKAKAETIVRLPAPSSKPAEAIPVSTSPSLESPDVPKPQPLEPIMTATSDFTRFFPAYEQVIAFHKGNIEALVEANKLFVAGAQEISKEFFAQAQEHLQSAAAAGQAVFHAKNPKDAIELNVENARAAYVKLVATSTKLSELSAKLASDAFAPVKARLDVAVETLTKAA